MSKTGSRQGNAERERYWREVIRAQERSGQSVRAYCREAGVKEAAFYRWRRELARRSEGRQAAGSRLLSERKPGRSSARLGQSRPGEAEVRRKPRRDQSTAETPVAGGLFGGNASAFVPIGVLEDDGGANAGGVEIHLGDGRMIRVRAGFDRQTLQDVLAVLSTGGSAALEGRSC